MKITIILTRPILQIESSISYFLFSKRPVVMSEKWCFPPNFNFSPNFYLILLQNITITLITGQDCGAVWPGPSWPASTRGPTSPSTPPGTSRCGRGRWPTCPAGSTRSTTTPCPGSGTGTGPSSPLMATPSSTTGECPSSRPATEETSFWQSGRD